MITPSSPVIITPSSPVIITPHSSRDIQDRCVLKVFDGGAGGGEFNPRRGDEGDAAPHAAPHTPAMTEEEELVAELAAQAHQVGYVLFYY
jgi:hypothetical protein